MKYQIIWLVLQALILWVVWAGTKIQTQRQEKTPMQSAGVILGTLTYFLINNVILFLGGFFDAIIAKIF
ncbi:MAG: hypothetical protein MUF12_01950 [Sediminibacterium sp.]|jgi:vancomycin permeability regulator SanA|nr:hypothetical protein [Sediminibacterium sp.]